MSEQDGFGNEYLLPSIVIKDVRRNYYPDQCDPIHSLVAERMYAYLYGRNSMHTFRTRRPVIPSIKTKHRYGSMDRKNKGKKVENARLTLSFGLSSPYYAADVRRSPKCFSIDRTEGHHTRYRTEKPRKIKVGRCTIDVSLKC